MKNTGKKITSIIISAILAVCFVAASIALFIFDDINGKNPLNPFFSTLYGLVNKIEGKTVIQDIECDIYLLKNGNLAAAKVPLSPSKYEDNLSSLKQFLDEKGIGMEYVITAESGDERMGQLPKGVKTNNCESVSNELMETLTKCGINYIDTYQDLVKGDMDYYDYFYKTDHHWNDHAGLYISQVVAEQLTADYGLTLDQELLATDKHRVKKYKKLFLGSLGKKTGLVYASPEDFEMLLPKYQTDFTINKENSVAKVNRKGSYENTLIFKKHLKKNYYKQNTYAAYLDGNNAINNIENHLANNDTRLLILQDSKANVVVPHLACATKYIDIIDLRLYKDSVRDYITQTQPDAVLIIQSPFAGDLFYDFA